MDFFNYLRVIAVKALAVVWKVLASGLINCLAATPALFVQVVVDPAVTTSALFPTAEISGDFWRPTV